jgi:hypothetical protein
VWVHPDELCVSHGLHWTWRETGVIDTVPAVDEAEAWGCCAGE